MFIRYNDNHVHRLNLGISESWGSTTQTSYRHKIIPLTECETFFHWWKLLMQVILSSQLHSHDCSEWRDWRRGRYWIGIQLGLRADLHVTLVVWLQDSTRIASTFLKCAGSTNRGLLFSEQRQFEDVTGCPTQADTSVTLKCIWFPPHTHLYQQSKLTIGWLSPHPPPTFPRFPGNRFRVEEKSKSCEGTASFSPLSLPLLVSVCLRVHAYKGASLHAFTPLSARHCSAERSTTLNRRERERGGGRKKTKRDPCVIYSEIHFFTPTCFSSSFISLRVSALLGRWLHRCKMGCGNSSATNTSGDGECFIGICV